MVGAGARGRARGALVAALLVVALLVGVAVWFVLAPDATSQAPPVAAHSQGEPIVRASEPQEPAKPKPAPVERSAASDNVHGEDAPPYGDLFALLAWLEQPGRRALPEVVGDAAGFQNLFASQHRERWVQVPANTKPSAEAWSEGAVLAFEPGVWRLDDVVPTSGALPADVTLAGSGMSRTLLLLGGLELSARLERFTLRDCTVFTDNRALIDLPRELAAVTCERARLIAFDSGQAPSPLFRARGLGLQMSDCEILGGYGRAPGSGSLFDVPSSALLARFERCKFEGLRLGLDALKSCATLVCVDGTTSALVEDPSTALASHPGISFTSTPFELLPSGQRPPAHELEGLFKNWRALLK